MNAAYLSEEGGKTDFEQTRPKLQKKKPASKATSSKEKLEEVICEQHI